MSLFVSWVVFPFLMVALSLGCGLLLEEAAGIRLPGALVIPAGLGLIFVITHFATATDTTAKLAAPAVLAAAVIGFGLRPPWQRASIDTIDRWAVGVGVGILALYSLPIVMSGSASFTGYIKLDDTATWLALTDQLMDHGRHVSGLEPSSYEATVQINLGGGYPWGAFPALGLGHELMGTDSAWLFQPYLGLLGAMLGLSLYVLSAPLVASRALRALAAFIASQAALLFGYYLWGGIKEMAAAWLLAMLAALVGPLLHPPSELVGRIRALIPIAIASSALIGVLSFGGAAWLGPILLAAAVLLYLQLGPRPTLELAGAFVALGILVALPSVLTATTFLSPSSGTLTSATDLGNLFQPLKFVQIFGIWPEADFRHVPKSLDVTHVLIFVVIAFTCFGAWEGWRRKSWPFLIYIGAALVGGFVIFQFASPWVGAKALATASPAFLFAALVAASALFERGRRTEAVLAAGAIIAGVLWSNALAYQGVTIAPRDRLHELEQVGDDIAGEGPTLMTDYEPYGVRHFLRKADPEGASELRRRPIPLRNGQQLGKIGYADIDEFTTDAVLTYRTLVLRRSPVSSRPPSPYNLIKSGDYYETWQRLDPLPGRIIEHLSLGQNPDPASVPGCAAIERLAREAGPGGMLAAVREPSSPIVLPLATSSHPPDWKPLDTGQITPTGPGTLQTSVQIPRRGQWGVWIGGAFRDRLEVLVDGRRVADLRHKLSHTGPYTPLAFIELDQGPHSVALRYHGKDWHPGSGGDPFEFGPLAFSLERATPPITGGLQLVSHLPDVRKKRITYVKPADARSLCGQRLDWVEAIQH